MTFRWVSKEPWEKFKRATFMPARIICSMVSADSDAGPMVQTILVLLGGSVMENLLSFLGAAARRGGSRTALTRTVPIEKV